MDKQIFTSAKITYAESEKEKEVGQLYKVHIPKSTFLGFTLRYEETRYTKDEKYHDVYNTYDLRSALGLFKEQIGNRWFYGYSDAFRYDEKNGILYRKANIFLTLENGKEVYKFFDNNDELSLYIKTAGIENNLKELECDRIY